MIQRLFEQPDLVVGKPAHGWGLQLNELISV